MLLLPGLHDPPPSAQTVTENFVLYDVACRENISAGHVIRMHYYDDIDAIIGPACSNDVQLVATLGGFYNLPVFAWASIMDSEVFDASKYPSLVTTGINSQTFVKAIFAFFDLFDWTEFAYVYSVDSQQPNAQCEYFQDDFDTQISLQKKFVVTYKRNIANDSDETVRLSMDTIKDQARIVVGCFDSFDDRRRFMKLAHEAAMTSDDYVYIFIELRSINFRTFDGKEFWAGGSVTPDGQDSFVREAFSRVFVLNVERANSTYSDIDQDVIQGARDYPVYCQNSNNCPTQNDKMAVQAPFLADTLYIYAIALNRSWTIDGPEGTRNGSRLTDHCRGSYEGFSGALNFNDQGYRDPTFQFIGLDAAYNEVVYVTVSISNDSYAASARYSDQSINIWATRGGVVPLSHPVCGFKGTECPPPFWENNYGYVAGGGSAFALLVGLIVAAIYYIYAARTAQRAALDRMWQIPSTMLEKVADNSEITKSFHSMRSGASSTSTRVTAASMRETQKYAYFIFEKESVAGRKHSARPRLTETEHQELRNMRQLDHDNLCRFIGLCNDASGFISVWKYCARNSLKDVIEKASIQMDAFFVVSLIRDVAEGLYQIHSLSWLRQHGHLTSKCCLIDERWQVKVSYYGLSMFKKLEQRTPEDMIWSAPELLRGNDLVGTQPGDIYSLAVIATEVVNRRPPWNMGEEDIDPDEIVYRVKRGGPNPYRPAINVDPAMDINASLVHLIRDSWTEDPEARPKIELVRNVLKAMHSGRAGNLMDHVFSLLEQYTSNLEQEVESRTRELAEEKKKSDILLYRMLPPSVAERLKMGQSVEPESFDQVTVFFCDVVSFTTLASQCTPLQVVNLLNDLYSMFDTVIEEHGCYKVETIGDAYLCVSGLPQRNGDRHAGDIADMSFDFLRALRGFRIPHMPNERVNIRIGLHTGPCVAGVVGLTMPRYCLFGDTINTASRMESNGKPGRIHISPTTNHYLTNIIGGYRTKSRGEVIIKGKGVMETFFLLTQEEIAEEDRKMVHNTPESADGHNYPRPSDNPIPSPTRLTSDPMFVSG